MRVPESGHPEEPSERDISAAYPNPAVDPIKLQDAISRAMTKVAAFTYSIRGKRRFVVRQTCPGRWVALDTQNGHATWHPTWHGAMARVTARTEIRPTRRIA